MRSKSRQEEKRPFAVGTAVSWRSTGSNNQESGHSWRECSRGGARGEESAAVTCSWAPQGLWFCGNPEVKGQVFRCWKFFRVDRKYSLSLETNREVVKQSDIECLSALWVCVPHAHVWAFTEHVCIRVCCLWVHHCGFFMHMSVWFHVVYYYRFVCLCSYSGALSHPTPSGFF